MRTPLAVLTEATIADIQVPQVYPQVVRRDVCLLVRVDGDGVDVVCMSVGVDFAGNSSDNIVLLLHTRQLELRVMGWWWYGSLAFCEVGL